MVLDRSKMEKLEKVRVARVFRPYILLKSRPIGLKCIATLTFWSFYHNISSKYHNINFNFQNIHSPQRFSSAVNRAVDKKSPFFALFTLFSSSGRRLDSSEFIHEHPFTISLPFMLLSERRYNTR